MAETTANHIALLAPVPLVHLESALQTETPNRQHAFGSKAWEVFNELEKSRAGQPVDVYIYESHPDGSFNGRATWHARYIRLETDRQKATPYRPRSTEADTFQSEVYWIVEKLRRMQSDESIPVSEFIGLGQKKPYGKAFAPRRPLLIEHPL